MERKTSGKQWELSFTHEKDILLNKDDEEAIGTVLQVVGNFLSMGWEFRTPSLRTTFLQAIARVIYTSSPELLGAHQILLQEDIYSQEIRDDFTAEDIFGEGIDEV